MIIFSFVLISCVETLTQYNDKSKPKEKYNYYTPDFILPDNTLLRTDGYYIDAKDNIRTIPIPTNKENKQLKKDTVIHSQQIFTVTFCKNGIFRYIYFVNASGDSIDRYMNVNHKEICIIQDGKDFYRIKGNKIDTESYTWYSGFFYNKALITKDTLYYGSYNRYKDGRAGQIFIPFKKIQ